MNRLQLRSWASHGLRVGLGALFIYAGLQKIVQPREFAASMASFQILPGSWITPAADSLPFFETLAGFWLALGWRWRTPALALLLLSAIFLVAIAQAWARGLTISCGCFGETNHSYAYLLTRDTLLLAVAVWVYRCAVGKYHPVEQTQTGLNADNLKV